MSPPRVVCVRIRTSKISRQDWLRTRPITVVVSVINKEGETVLVSVIKKKGETGSGVLFVCRPNILLGIPSNVFLSFFFVITLNLTLGDYNFHSTVMMKHLSKHQNTPGVHLKVLFVPSIVPGSCVSPRWVYLCPTVGPPLLPPDTIRKQMTFV